MYTSTVVYCCIPGPFYRRPADVLILILDIIVAVASCVDLWHSTVTRHRFRSHRMLWCVTVESPNVPFHIVLFSCKRTVKHDDNLGPSLHLA